MSAVYGWVEAETTTGWFVRGPVKPDAPGNWIPLYASPSPSGLRERVGELAKQIEYQQDQLISDKFGRVDNMEKYAGLGEALKLVEALLAEHERLREQLQAAEAVVDDLRAGHGTAFHMSVDYRIKYNPGTGESRDG